MYDEPLVRLYPITRSVFDEARYHRAVPGGDHGGYPQRAIPDAGVSLHRGGRVGRIEQKPDASPIRVGTVGVREANPWLYEDCLNTIWNEPTHGATCERVRCTARRPNKEEL